MRLLPQGMLGRLALLILCAFLAALPSGGTGGSVAPREAIVHACRALVAPGLAAAGALLLAAAAPGWIALVPVPTHLLLAALWSAVPAALVAALAAWLRVLLRRDPEAGRLRPDGGELPHVRRLLAGLGERLSVAVPETGIFQRPRLSTTGTNWTSASFSGEVMVISGALPSTCSVADEVAETLPAASVARVPMV